MDGHWAREIGTKRCIRASKGVLLLILDLEQIDSNAARALASSYSTKETSRARNSNETGKGKNGENADFRTINRYI